MRHPIVSGTESWCVIRTWKATYWKTLSEGTRIGYQKRKQDHDDIATGCNSDKNLWSFDWHSKRHAKMHRYTPMPPSRGKALVSRSPWRVEFRRVVRHDLEKLPVLLHHEDKAIQYAAAMRLAQ